MAPTLHHVSRTISSPIVQCLLELDVVNKPVVIVEKEFSDLKLPSHLAINPMGTSPAFQDGALILWESGAVLDYLLERYDPTFRLHPPPITDASSAAEIAKRAKYLQLKQYIIATVYPFIASLVIHKFIKPPEDQDAAYVSSATAKIKDLLIPTLVQWLGRGPYFLGSGLSSLDFLAAKPLNNLKLLGLLSVSPPLEALFGEIAQRSTFPLAYATTAQDCSAIRNFVLVPSKAVVSAESVVSKASLGK
jgi:glutathione S-transferase